MSDNDLMWAMVVLLFILGVANTVMLWRVGESVDEIKQRQKFVSAMEKRR